MSYNKNAYKSYKTQKRKGTTITLKIEKNMHKTMLWNINCKFKLYIFRNLE